MAKSKAFDFRRRLVDHGKKVRRKATLLVNGITFKLYAEIVSSSEHPVDTGRARAGWAISVYVVGDHLPPEGTYGVPSSEEFVAELKGAPLEAKRIIYNNVHYVVWLELGSEKAEGNHFVKMAIQRLKAAA